MPEARRVQAKSYRSLEEEFELKEGAKAYEASVLIRSSCGSPLEGGHLDAW